MRKTFWTKIRRCIWNWDRAVRPLNWGGHPQRLGFVAQMVDQRFVFDGPHWRFGGSPLQGLYYRPMVYQEVRGLDDFQPWLDRILHFPEAVVDQALKQIPAAWVLEDEAALSVLCEQLLARRKRVIDLLEACRHGRTPLFPRWH